MAILDRQNLLSWKQAITVSAASTDIIDLGPNMWSKSSGSDRDIPLGLFVDEAFIAAGAATLQVDIQSSNDKTFATGVVTHNGVNLPKANLVTTKKLPKSLNIPVDAKRYVRANYTVATGPFTAGKLTLGVVASQMTNIVV